MATITEQFHRTVQHLDVEQVGEYRAYIDADGEPVYRYRTTRVVLHLTCGHTQTWHGRDALDWTGRTDVHCYACARAWEVAS